MTIYDDVDIGGRSILHSGCVIGADGFGFNMVGDHWEKFPQVGRVSIGADVEISDLRAGASLILAALAATGTSTIHGGHHVRRGYENIESKFLDLGAKIERVQEEDPGTPS